MTLGDRKMTIRSTNNERLMAHSRYAIKTEDPPSRRATGLGRRLRLLVGHARSSRGAFPYTSTVHFEINGQVVVR
jgi:hypothetical protein